MPRFQVHAVADDHNPVERQPWLGAKPSDELVNGELVDATRGWRAEAIEYCQLAVVQVRQSKNSAPIVWFCSVCTHANGLPRRGIGNYSRLSGNASSV